jgi:hypothetical protein
MGLSPNKGVNQKRAAEAPVAKPAKKAKRETAKPSRVSARQKPKVQIGTL